MFQPPSGMDRIIARSKSSSAVANVMLDKSETVQAVVRVLTMLHFFR
jgi:hypothetical protein